MKLNELKKALTKKFVPTLAIDFDGVIHRYSEGWKDGTPYDKVTEDCVETLQKLKDKGYKIAIHTARICNYLGLDGLEINQDQVDMLKEYLEVNNIPYDFIAPKIVAEVYVDDRGFNFSTKNASLSWKELHDLVDGVPEVE